MENEMLIQILQKVTIIASEVDLVKNEVQNHTNILQNHEKILQKHTETIQHIAEELQNLKDITIRMEFDHGEQLAALFDAFQANEDHYKEHGKKIEDLEHTKDMHSMQIGDLFQLCKAN